MIILAFQGSGKTYAANKYPGTVSEIDVKEGFDSYGDYAEALIEADKDANCIFGNANIFVAKELLERGTDISIFAPWKENLSERDYEDIKTTIFGRYVLRQEQKANSYKWLERMKRHFDSFASKEHYKELETAYPGRIQYLTMDKNAMSCCDII